MNKEKAVVILSGGLDSTTLLYVVINQGFDVRALSFDYNQKHKKELWCAMKTCTNLGIEHKVLELAILNEIAPSALTRADWQMPEGHYAAENMKQTIVPNRNMIMISLAAAYAIGVGAQHLFYGAHAGDHDIYPDCRKEFVIAMQEVLKLCDWKQVQLHAPYLDIDKGDIVKKGLALSVPYQDTWTCYQGLEEACGRCGSCQERLEAFAKNHTTDPIVYKRD